MHKALATSLRLSTLCALCASLFLNGCLTSAGADSNSTQAQNKASAQYQTWENHGINKYRYRLSIRKSGFASTYEGPCVYSPPDSALCSLTGSSSDDGTMTEAAHMGVFFSKVDSLILEVKNLAASHHAADSLVVSDTSLYYGFWATDEDEDGNPIRVPFELSVIYNKDYGFPKSAELGSGLGATFKITNFSVIAGK